MAAVQIDKEEEIWLGLQAAVCPTYDKEESSANTTKGYERKTRLRTKRHRWLQTWLNSQEVRRKHLIKLDKSTHSSCHIKSYASCKTYPTYKYD